MINDTKYIHPWSAKANALILYRNGTHSHNASWLSKVYPDFVSWQELRDIAMDHQADVNSSGLAKSGLVYGELLEETRGHYELIVNLTQTGERALEAVTSGYVWNTETNSIDLAATALLYERMIGNFSAIGRSTLDAISGFKDEFLQPYVRRLVAKRLKNA